MSHYHHHEEENISKNVKLTNWLCWILLHFELHLSQEFVGKYCAPLRSVPMSVIFRCRHLGQNMVDSGGVFWVTQGTSHCSPSLAACGLLHAADIPDSSTISVRTMSVVFKITTVCQEHSFIFRFSCQKNIFAGSLDFRKKNCLYLFLRKKIQ